LAKQLRILDEEIKTADTLIKEIDEIIVLYQQQKTALVNNRAKLNSLKAILQSASVINSQSFEVSKGPTTSAVGGAVGIVVGAFSPIVGAAISGGVIINQALDDAIHAVDERNARIEQKLQEQREWKESHPGHKPVRTR